MNQVQLLPGPAMSEHLVERRRGEGFRQLVQATGQAQALVVPVAWEALAGKFHRAELDGNVACERPGVGFVMPSVERMVEHAVQHGVQAVAHELVGAFAVEVDHALGVVLQHPRA